MPELHILIAVSAIRLIKTDVHEHSPVNQEREWREPRVWSTAADFRGTLPVRLSLISPPQFHSRLRQCVRMYGSAADYRCPVRRIHIVPEETRVPDSRVTVQEEKSVIAGFIGQQVTYGCTSHVTGKADETAVFKTPRRNAVTLKRLLVLRTVIGHDYLIRYAQLRSLDMQVFNQPGAVPVIDRYEYGQ